MVENRLHTSPMLHLLFKSVFFKTVLFTCNEFLDLLFSTPSEPSTTTPTASSASIWNASYNKTSKTEVFQLPSAIHVNLKFWISWKFWFFWNFWIFEILNFFEIFEFLNFLKILKFELKTTGKFRMFWNSWKLTLALILHKIILLKCLKLWSRSWRVEFWSCIT